MSSRCRVGAAARRCGAAGSRAISTVAVGAEQPAGARARRSGPAPAGCGGSSGSALDDGQPPRARGRGPDHAGTAAAQTSSSEQAEHEGRARRGTRRLVDAARGGRVARARLRWRRRRRPADGCALAAALPRQPASRSRSSCRHQLASSSSRASGPGACCRRLALACGRQLGHEPWQGASSTVARRPIARRASARRQIDAAAGLARGGGAASSAASAAGERGRAGQDLGDRGEGHGGIGSRSRALPAAPRGRRRAAPATPCSRPAPRSALRARPGPWR